MEFLKSALNKIGSFIRGLLDTVLGSVAVVAGILSFFAIIANAPTIALAICVIIIIDGAVKEMFYTSPIVVALSAIASFALTVSLLLTAPSVGAGLFILQTIVCAWYVFDFVPYADESVAEEPATMTDTVASQSVTADDANTEVKDAKPARNLKQTATA